jgi:hypothetical protein
MAELLVRMLLLLLRAAKQVEASAIVLWRLTLLLAFVRSKVRLRTNPQCQYHHQQQQHQEVSHLQL